MRRLLDVLYAGALWLAAGSILAICAIVSAQVGLNVLARLGGAGLSFTIPSYADFAGFLLGAATFLALGPTLIAGSHIRVGLLVHRLPPRLAWGAEIVALVTGLVLSVAAVRYMGGLMFESWRFGDRSPGIVAVPLWIPQAVEVFGLLVLTVAFLDLLVRCLRTGRPVVPDAQELEDV